MAFKLFSRLQTKIAFVFSLLVIIMVAIFFSFALRVYESEQKVAFELRAVSLASLLGESAANALYDLRFDQLRLLLGNVLEQPQVLYAYAYDKEGRILADGTKANRYFNTILDDPFHSQAIQAQESLIQYKDEEFLATGNVLNIAQPIFLASNEKLGGVRIGFTLLPVQQKITKARRYTLFLGTIFALVGGILSALMGRRLVKPIENLVRGTQLISSGNLDVKLSLSSRDELGMLADSFNQMAASLKQNKAALQRYTEELEATVESRTRELQEANRGLEAASRHKSQFLANVSHELRTPLNAIIGFTRLILRKTEGQIPQLQKENLRKVLISAEHLLSLINGLLDLSKIEAGRMEIFVEPVKVDEVITMAASTIEPMLKDGRVRLIKEIAPGLPSLHTDREKLHEIILNLLSNAAKFTEEGEIKVSAWQKDGSVKLAVSDTGIGMKKEALHYIFEEFRQVDMSSTRRYGGTGLGLAIVKKLVTLLGGDIGVESEVGKGTTFTITLPVSLQR